MAAIRSVTAIAIGAVLLALPAAAQSEQGFSPLLEDGLKGWTRDRANSRIKAGVLTVERGAWLTFDKAFENFVARLEVRTVRPDTRAGILVRSWPTFNPKTGFPSSAYVVVAAAADGGALIGAIVEYGEAGVARTLVRPGRPEINAADGGWHSYEIECVGDSIKVTVDGTLTSEAVQVVNGFGLLGFSVAAGVVEVRNVAVRQLEKSRPKLPDGVYGGDDKTLVLPRVLHEVKPNYTSEAIGRRIQGFVLIQTVIDRDGRPTQPKIIKSLDPYFGLDREALKAASAWRFQPGLKDGQPVPVMVMIELTFTLKR